MTPQIALLLSLLWLQNIGNVSQPEAHSPATSAHAVHGPEGSMN